MLAMRTRALEPLTWLEHLTLPSFLPMGGRTQQLLHIPQENFQCSRVPLRSNLCQNEGFGYV